MTVLASTISGVTIIFKASSNKASKAVVYSLFSSGQVSNIDFFKKILRLKVSKFIFYFF
jgi:hypothetical protein